MNVFYALVNNTENRKISSSDFLPIDTVEIGDAPKCPKCGKYLGMRPLLGNIVVDLELRGDSIVDVCFGSGDEVLFSQRLKSAFEAAQLTGANFRTVEVLNVKTDKRWLPPIPPYYLTSICRSRAVVDAAESGVEWDGTVDCKECNLGGILKRLRKVVFVPGTWSGEDIFFARGLPGTIFTSQRFYSMFSDLNLSNNFLIPITKFSIDHYPWERM